MVAGRSMDRHRAVDGGAGVLDVAAGTILPGAYLVEKARLAGIPVVAADMHQDIAQAFTDETGLTANNMLNDLGDPHSGIWHQMRAEQAANTVKDFTLAAQPWNLAQKPTYALVFGKGHTHETTDPYGVSAAMEYGGIPGAFDRLGLSYGLTEKADAVDFRVERRQQARRHVGSLPVASMVEVNSGANPIPKQ